MGELNDSYEPTIDWIYMALITEFYINQNDNLITVTLDNLHKVFYKNPAIHDGGPEFVQAIENHPNWLPGVNYFDGESIINAGPVPAYGVWSWETNSFVINLASAKEAGKNRINAARLLANGAGFGYAGKTFSTDTLSRGDIDGINGYAGLYSALPPDWAGAWKAADNTYLAIPDLDAWKAFYSAMVATGSANFAKAQQLKAQLAAATTAEEVEAVVW